MKYDGLINLLPEIMKEEDNSKNFKNILKAYAEACKFIDDKTSLHGEFLHLYSCTGQDLNNLGYLYSVLRERGESDEDFRTRIIDTISKRKTAVSLPEIQQTIDSIVDSGKLWILPNYDDNPCNVYITGTANELDIKRASKVAYSLLGAGIGVTIPVYSFNTWQNIKDQFSTWGSLGQQDYIW